MNKFGQSALHHAVKLSVCRLLLRHGARADELDLRGRSAAQTARERGADEDVVRELNATSCEQQRACYLREIQDAQKEAGVYEASVAVKAEQRRVEQGFERASAQRADYLEWRTGEVSGNEVLARRLKRRDREARWARIMAGPTPHEKKETKIPAAAKRKPHSDRTGLDDDDDKGLEDDEDEDDAREGDLSSKLRLPEVSGIEQSKHYSNGMRSFTTTSWGLPQRENAAQRLKETARATPRQQHSQSR